MMKFVKAATLLSVLLISGNATAASAGRPSKEVDPADYPALDDYEIGHVRRWVKLARQLPGDWSGLDDDAFRTVERLTMFQIGFMAAGFGLVQHQYTPAYRELYRECMDALLQKLTLPDMWEYWINSSRQGSVGNPGEQDLSEGWIDPVAKDNIFLKGYLVQSGALYDMFYRDGKYNKSDAFTFRFVPNTWGNGPVTFRYSLPDLAGIIHQEFVDRNYEGVLCEPNRMYPACNQPPILGLITFDQVNGTKYSADVVPKFKATWVRKNYTNPVTKQNVAYVAAQQDQAESGNAYLDGWSGSLMAAWAPDMMATIYPGQRDLYLPQFLSGAYAKDGPPTGTLLGNTSYISVQFGLFGFMAAEMGDQDTRRKLLEYAEKNFHPVWQDGTYYFPRNGNYKTTSDGASHGMDTWTGNVLLALMRLDKGGGFRRMYSEPWGKAELEAPQITDVDDLVTNVSQAYYDATKRALIVTLKPGPVKATRTEFRIRNLSSDLSYRVIRNGETLGVLTRKGPGIGDDISWKDDGTVAVRTSIVEPVSYVFVGKR
jgi:hypothetical protein